MYIEYVHKAAQLEMFEKKEIKRLTKRIAS